MKLLTIIIITFFTFSIFAQRSMEQVEQGPQNYERALKSNITGMVESAIFQSVNFKLHYPGMNTDGITFQLNRLSREGQTETVRYKAFLASYFIQNPQLLSRIKRKLYKDEVQFFKMLTETLNSKLIVRN